MLGGIALAGAGLWWWYHKKAAAAAAPTPPLPSQSAPVLLPLSNTNAIGQPGAGAIPGNASSAWDIAAATAGNAIAALTPLAPVAAAAAVLKAVSS